MGSAKPGIAKRTANSILKRFGYDATKDTGRRRSPQTATYGEDGILPRYKRQKLNATTRDIQRNFTIAAWGIRKHLDYVSTFSFQSRTGDKAFDDRFEELMAWWSLKENCDVRKKHNLKQMIRLAEESRTVDGDMFMSRLASGHIQGLESRRICDPNATSSPKAKEGGSIVQGVVLDPVGAATDYILCKPYGISSSAMQFEKLLPAGDVYHNGYFDRYDQVRGISRLAGAIDTFQDLYEGLGYALAKAKVAQLFGLVTYRDASEPIGDITESEDNDDDGPRYKVDFGQGPFHLDLDDGDKAEFLGENSPSPAFQQYAQEMIAASLKALDIPYSFYNESFTNYSGNRSALLSYNQSAAIKRQDNISMLDWITLWKLQTWLARGLIQMPRGKTTRQAKWNWVPKGLPWIDPLKEVMANAKAIETGQRSRQQIAKEAGLDFFETADQLAEEKEYLESKNLTEDEGQAAGMSDGLVLQAILGQDEDKQKGKE